MNARIGLIGLPYDNSSSCERGAAAAPPLIRNAFLSPSSSLYTEHGIDLGAKGVWQDCGDAAIPEKPESARAAIRQAITEVMKSGMMPLSLGGDHSITYPIMQAVAERHPVLTILQFDAHGDLYDEFEGDKYSHACPFARIMEEGIAQRLVQVGPRTLNQHQRDQAKRFGVKVIEMRDFVSAAMLKFDTPIYISFDMDGLDPAFAPGVSHHEGGGFSTRQALDIIHSIRNSTNAPVIGADLVEFNPSRDVGEITASACAKLLKELMGAML
jgi:arginase